MNFKDFCNRFCISSPVTLPDVPSGAATLEPDLYKRTMTLISNVRPQSKRFHLVPMTFITRRLSDTAEVCRCLDAYNDGNIPDFIFETLSRELYEHPFNQLRHDYQNIIETLAVYIIVSHVRDSINK